MISRKIEKVREHLVKYKEKRRQGGKTNQEMILMKRTAGDMVANIRNDFHILQDLLQTKTDTRIFKRSIARDEERIQKNTDDLLLIDQHVQAISRDVSRMDDSKKSDSKSNLFSKKENIPSNVKVEENDALPSLDVSDSMMRLGKSKAEFEKNMTIVRDQLVLMGEKNQEIKSQLELSLEKLDSKVVQPVEAQNAQLEELNKDLTKAKEEAQHNFYRMIMLGGFIVVFLILVVVGCVFLFKSNIF